MLYEKLMNGMDFDIKLRSSKLREYVRRGDNMYLQKVYVLVIQLKVFFPLYDEIVSFKYMLKKVHVQIF